MDQERDRLKHLLIILLDALSATKPEQAPNRATIQDKAEAAGLDDADMHGLLDWIESQWRFDASPGWTRQPLSSAPSPATFRHFSVEDLDYLTPEALTWLVKLQEHRQIEKAQLEALLQYASFMAMRPLDVEDMEMVIEQGLFRGHNPGMTGGVSEGQEGVH